ncbi:cupin domain-containing protein [Edaphobacillus lindanitolerans]|uniref:Cupin domain-containing protein n=1 Tax=Edaphobacillus lindanitolerans TaxID=550447 RepID=A0A1U7PNP7_9BACI|nr:cupin domain-containing protein [Edaphobacillus lindanitolerans]SIT73996.1 Cupin domain-containing protein [Edaphobacillus lindanitolerans]
MIKQAAETIRIDHSHGGEGSIDLSRIVVPEDRLEGIKLFARVTVHPRSTIAYHIHREESEVYYLLEGKGIFIDNGGKRIPVTAGDFCMIQKGQGHGIENPHDEKIEMLAIVF